MLLIVPRSVFEELDDPQRLPYFLAADYIADLIYLVDIFARMLTSYLKEADGIYIKEPRKLIRHWLKSNLGRMDIVSLIPTDVAFFWLGLQTPYACVRINRVLKYGRVWEFLRLTESRISAGELFRLAILVR